MTMPTWEAVVASSLAGTARQPIPERASSGRPADSDPERGLLSAAAELAVRRLAGWTPPRGDPPGGALCPPEERPAVSPEAAQRLAWMLGGDRADLLPEWLELAAANRRVVPHRLLPALLAYAESRLAVREAVVGVIGRRGRWLAAQVPRWDFAALEDLDKSFATGARPTRAAALRELRRRDPAGALRRLAETWPSESGEDRAALIGCLLVRLGSADEEFLQAATGDSRKEVRQSALTLLARLPDSRLVERMRERVEPMVIYRKGLLGGKLQVTPPERCGPELVADGVEPKPPRGMGEKAWWLSQMLGLVPPAAWPAEAVDAAGGSDWTAALLRGWAAAAGRFQDTRWADALVQLWTRTPEERRSELPFSPEPLLNDLEPADRDAILVRVIGRSSLDGARLAVRCDHQWGEELTRALLGQIPGLARSSSHIAAQVAVQAGFLGAVAAQAEAERLAAKTTDVPWVDRALADLADTLNWRALMAKELTT